MPKLLQNLSNKEIQVVSLLVLYTKLSSILRVCHSGGLYDLEYDLVIPIRILNIIILIFNRFFELDFVNRIILRGFSLYFLYLYFYNCHNSLMVFIE